MKEAIRIITVKLFLLLLIPMAYSQEGAERGNGYEILKEKSIEIRTGEENAVSAIKEVVLPRAVENIYFRDEKALSHIINLEKKVSKMNRRDEASLMLRELDLHYKLYINKFGLENFRRDTKLLWKAGRVKQLLKDTLQALVYYELASIHDHGLKAPKLAYDSLIAPKHNDWLPIDEYYELIAHRKRIDTVLKPRKVLVSLGTSVNSDKPEYAPFTHPRDSILLFTSRRDEVDIIDPFAKPNEDLYYTYKDFVGDGWVVAEKFSEDINSKYNEGSACLSPDGNTLFFTRCNSPDGLGDCDIYVAEYDAANETWHDVKNLGKTINSSYWDSQPNVSADGNSLYFSSNRAGGFGGTDLYMTQKDESGKWQTAVNLGPIINSSRNEVTPFFHRINNTLYFSSTGHLRNLGGFDIYRSRWMGQFWEPPKNVGPLVNTNGNEYYFSIDGGADKIFYARSDGGDDHFSQNFDLYSFDMPMEAKPDAVSLLEGYLVDSVSGYPLQGKVVLIDLDKNVEVAPKEINEKGYFSFELIKNRKYRMYVMGENFLTIKKDMMMNSDTSFSILTKSFEQNRTLVFETLRFGSNSYKLKSRIKPKLDYIVRFLEHYPMFDLVVEGHTDSDGRDDYNLKLSQQRSEMIAKYITQTGSFDEGRVTAHGYGETKPIVPNDTDENKKTNRRVEFKLILNPDFKGDEMLPTSDELFFGDDLEDDENDKFNEEWEMLEKGSEKSDKESRLDAAEENNIDLFKEEADTPPPF